MHRGSGCAGPRDASKLLPVPEHYIPVETQMFSALVILLAAIGAGLILTALAFVSTLIGILVNAMIVLFAGAPIDRMLAKKSSS